MADTLAVLADPQRLHILDLIINGIHCSSGIVERLGLAPNLVSHHLKVLREAGLVDIERDPADRRWIYYVPDIQQLTEIQFLLTHFLHPARIQGRAGQCGPSQGAQTYTPPDYLLVEKEHLLNTKKAKIIFLCTGNSARSQMAEAFMKKHGGDLFEAHSAGIEPKGINPYTTRVMDEIGIDISGQQSKGVRQYLGQINFGYVITVCDHAEENCPTVFLTQGKHLHWSFEDPAAFEGTEEETLVKFRQIRDQIEARIKDFLEEYRAND
jgi:arsenate reductase